MVKSKKIVCNPGDARTRAYMATAHAEGAHGREEALEILQYWAQICLDCHDTLNRLEVKNSD